MAQSPVKVSFGNKHFLQREYGQPRENVYNFDAYD